MTYVYSLKISQKLVGEEQKERSIDRKRKLIGEGQETTGRLTVSK